MCDPILVLLMKMQTHYSKSSGENAIPSSGTSPLAYYQEVPPLRLQLYKICSCSVILAQLESFQNNKGFSLIFLKNNFTCNLRLYEGENTFYFFTHLSLTFSSLKVLDFLFLQNVA